MLPLGLAMQASAAPACALLTPSSDADSTWVAAWREVDEKLRARGGSKACSTIELRMHGDRADVVLTTSDGKHAVREVEQPFELASTTDALLLTLGTGSNASEAITSQVVANPDWPRNLPSQETGPPNNAPTALSRLSVGGLGGARFGGGLVTPIVDLFATLAAPPWELGVVGQWEIAYQSLGGTSGQRWSGSGLAAGVTIGRHQSLGSSLDLDAGARLEGVVLHQETNHRHPEEWTLKADGRVGVVVGATIPRRSPVRFRMEVAVDTLLGGSPPPASPDVPSLSSWGASVAIGVEANGP